MKMSKYNIGDIVSFEYRGDLYTALVVGYRATSSVPKYRVYTYYASEFFWHDRLVFIDQDTAEWDGRLVGHIQEDNILNRAFDADFIKEMREAIEQELADYEAPPSKDGPKYDFPTEVRDYDGEVVHIGTGIPAKEFQYIKDFTTGKIGDDL